ADRALVTHGQRRLAVLAADAHADAVGPGQAGGVHRHAGVGAAHRRELVDPAVLLVAALVHLVADGVPPAVEPGEHGIGVGVGRVQGLHGDRVGVGVGRRQGARSRGVELALVDRVARGHAVGHVRDHGAVGAAQGDGGVAGVVVLDCQLAARTGRAFRTLWTRGAFRALRTFRPLRSRGAFGALRTVRSLRSLWPRGALRPFRPLGPGRSLRPGWNRVDAVLQLAQAGVDRGKRGAHVAIAAALDDVARRGEHPAAETRTAAQCRHEAPELADRSHVVVADAVGDIDQPALQVAAVGAAVDLVLVGCQVAEGDGIGLGGDRVAADRHRAFRVGQYP